MSEKTLDEYAEAFEAWAENVDAADLREADTASLRRIADLADRSRAVDDELAAAVTVARRDGWSWPAIGAMLGVSKQAAQQKYGQSAQTSRQPATQKPVAATASTLQTSD